MKAFYQVLANSLITSVTNNFVWFALVYWAYLETQSVLATSFTGGLYLAATAASSLWFGSLVDHHKKKTVMLVSSVVTLAIFILALGYYWLLPAQRFAVIDSVPLWLFIFIILAGVIAGNIRNIALPTLVTLLIPEGERDKAKGMVGTVMGISFSITSAGSGLILGYGGMATVLGVAIVLTILAIGHFLTIAIPEKTLVHSEVTPKKLDLKGTIGAIQKVPGLFALIFFTTFNNFLGGVFMALMDAYGLTLVSVQTWGLLFGVLSFGFIASGIYISKKGLGKNPLKTLFSANIAMWIVAMLFTVQASIVLLSVGIFIWICLVPFVEAVEQTIIQKVVPLERQGRVFGFAQTVEQAASPLTSFIIGPIAQFFFIPFMTTGAGVDLIGSWYGVGMGRGIALVFTVTGLIGLIVTVVAMRSKAYQLLAKRYLE